MRQQSLADGSFEKYRKKTRKELFLEEMDQIIPWQALTATIEPFYPKPEGAGRRPKGAERMLRIHFSKVLLKRQEENEIAMTELGNAAHSFSPALV